MIPGVKGNKKLLILDIDETLLHASPTQLNRDHDYDYQDCFIYLRPHLKQFFDFAFAHFRIAIWTAATREYAKEIMGPLLEGSKLEFFWMRERCIRHYNPDSMEEIFLKDLEKAKRRGFPLESILIIDDKPIGLKRNYGNLIPITPFAGDPADNELSLLMEYLPMLINEPNLRTIEKRNWRSKIGNQARDENA